MVVGCFWYVFCGLFGCPYLKLEHPYSPTETEGRVPRSAGCSAEPEARPEDAAFEIEDEKAPKGEREVFYNVLFSFFLGGIRTIMFEELELFHLWFCSV